MNEKPEILDTKKFAAAIRHATRIVITTHVNPDGDAIGSEIGLAEWLLSIGKNVSVINHSPTPQNYLFLDRDQPIVEQFDPAKHTTIFTSADLIVVLDVNDPSRLRSTGQFVTGRTPSVIVIDHHLEPKEFAEDYFVDTDATSTGEMISRLVSASLPLLGGSISKKSATALYAAIMTDTGSFRFPRTVSGTFRMCADLIDLGADPVAIYDEVYNTSPAARLLLIREALNSLGYYYDNRMALLTLTQAQILSTGATEEDVDGFVQIPFQVKGIVLSALLLQLSHGWKLSVRSKGDVSAAAIAQSFGGNGHFHAAGARIGDVKTTEEMQRAVIEAAGKLLS